MAHTVKVLPAAAPCGDQETGLDRDQPVCILIRHCRDMKRQETRLRLLTMLLLLGCSALYIFTLCAELRNREHQSSGDHRAAGPHQERLQTAVSSTEKKRFNIHLRQNHSVPKDTGTDERYIMWKQIIPEDNQCDQTRKDIVIPKDGVYFIYIRTSLFCRNATGAASSNMFYMQLRFWNENYNESRVLTDAREVVSCPPVAFRTVSVQQLFDLSEGDHVSVRIGAGYQLINKADFGAFLVEG
ncbi:uncharacterized protein LOC133974701 [Platichthys flesus]|uniref:uncharacterized protein LOC133974701 n=1 Tax=Platichthys flesus TaxID=8260 RepID=UPI002DBFE1FF|nr:uncharacterized protein LOC133974701 [Platichthys flesus]